MLKYPVGDVYPTGLAYTDTSNSTSVTGEDAETLHEDKSVVDQNRKGSNAKSILLALGVIACMAIFFGVE